jgi:TetR/AcrR family transcriptional regulator of autoinduction and epiphytic fitness
VGETSVTEPSPGPAQPSDAGHKDGRLTRAARTRASVVEALLTLNQQGNLRPTARDIAAEAGVSLRSLYVHFDDLEALFVAASRRHGERLNEMLPAIVTEGDLDTRLDAFLARRNRLFELGNGVRRAAQLQEPFSPAVQHALTSGRKALRAEVKACFEPEVTASDAVAPGRLLRALDIVTSPTTWETLRLHQALDADAAAEQVREMVLAFVHAWLPDGAAAGRAVPGRAEADTTHTSDSTDTPATSDTPDSTDSAAAGPQG